MPKGMKNWTEVKSRQTEREKKGCTVTVDKQKVDEIFKQYEAKLSNQNKYKKYGT